MDRKVSIKDIATEVGASTATVSLVLSNKHTKDRVKVGKVMAAKILATAKRLNYRPNLMARSLKGGLTKTIGLLVADITNPFFAQLAFQIQKQLQLSDYTVIIVNTDEDSEQMAKMISLLQSRQVDGFIIVPTEGSEKQIEMLHNDKTPMVLVDRYFLEIDTCNVLVDNFKAVYQSTLHLINKGANRIAYVSYDSDMIQFNERERGYHDAMIKSKKFNPADIYRVSYSNLSADIDSVINVMCGVDNRYDAVIFATNHLSIYGIKKLIGCGVKIGKDLDVICFDRSDAFEFLPVAIPCIHQPIVDIAIMASKLILEQIENTNSEHNNGSTFLLPCTFKV